jgi:DNA-binding MarR family transcriptional regulator
MENERTPLIASILDISDAIFRKMRIGLPEEWLTSDLTVAQLRVLLLLHTEGPSKMSAIAQTSGIALSTATGIVEHLVRKGFVSREADPQDRRLVVCRLSPQGQGLTDKIWSMAQTQMKRLLEGLTLAQLKQAMTVAQMLHDNVVPEPPPDITN